MNWEDELIEDCREDDGTLHPQTDHVLSGAHWMLRRLRTDEAVEKMARGICRRNWPKNEDFVHNWHWYCDDFRADARAAIDALRGED